MRELNKLFSGLFIFAAPVCFGQNVFMLQKGDSSIVIKTGEYPYFYNSIREVFDSCLYQSEKGNHPVTVDTISINSSFNEELNGWNVEWRVKRDSSLLQKGFFNILGRAEGEFNCFWVMDSSKCFYKSGIKEGMESFYRLNKFHVRQYKNGWLDGIYYVLDKHLLARITQYKGGKKHGIDQDYWLSTNGISLHYSDVYINGIIKDGKSYVYNPDGSVFAETSHKNGQLHGIYKIYGGRGTLLRFEKYRNGKMIKNYLAGK